MVPVFVLGAVAAAGASGVYQASADTTDDVKTERHGAFVEMFASKFNLKKEDVQKAFDEERQKKRAQRQQEMMNQQETYLTGLVSQGKLTETKKKLILDKKSEMMQQMKSDSNLTPQERHEKREQRRSGMEQWAKDNGIDTSLLMVPKQKGMKGFHHGHGGL